MVENVVNSVQKPFSVDESSIESRCDNRSLERGRGYFRSSAVYDAYLMDNTLHCQCSGSMQFDYTVTVSFSGNDIAGYQCDCPRGDFCKHIVALVLTYIHRFDRVRVIDFESEREKLAVFDKEELINRMISLYRENPRLLLDAENEYGEGEEVSLEEYIDILSGSADRCFRVYSDNLYRAAVEASRNLDALIEKNRNKSRGGKKRRMALLTAVYESVEEHIGEIDDSGAYVSAVAADCVHELKELTEDIELDTNERQKWLKRMLRYWVKNDYGLAGEVDNLVLRAMKDEDINFLKQYVNEALEKIPADSDWDNYKRGKITDFLAHLIKVSGEDPEIVLRLYKEKGEHLSYVFELLELDRVPEAVGYAKEYLNVGFKAYKFAKKLLEEEFIDEAEELLNHMVRNKNDKEPGFGSLYGLLAEIYIGQEKWELAGNIYTDAFGNHPSIENYKKLEGIADKLSDWQERKMKIIRFLKSDRNYFVLVGIALHLKDVELVRECINKESGFIFYPGHEIEVAKLLEEKYPDEAIAIYKDIIEDLIRRASRGSYAETVPHFKSIKRLLPPLEFNVYFTQIKTVNKRRWAFLEEVRRVDE